LGGGDTGADKWFSFVGIEAKCAPQSSAVVVEISATNGVLVGVGCLVEGIAGLFAHFFEPQEVPVVFAKFPDISAAVEQSVRACAIGVGIDGCGLANFGAEKVAKFGVWLTVSPGPEVPFCASRGLFPLCFGGDVNIVECTKSEDVVISDVDDGMFEKLWWWCVVVPVVEVLFIVVGVLAFLEEDLPDAVGDGCLCDPVVIEKYASLWAFALVCERDAPARAHGKASSWDEEHPDQGASVFGTQ
jgi:hypothetical protein